MDPLNATIVSLFAWIAIHIHLVGDGFVQPGHFPQVRYMPHAQMENLACDGKKCPVIGWYPKNQIEGKEVIYLINGVDPVNDLCIRTILLHEIIHFWQDYNEKFDEHEEIAKITHLLKEQQASQLENIYRYQQYMAHRKATGLPYSPRCCQGIAFGKCYNHPSWFDQYIKRADIDEIGVQNK